MAIDEAIDEAPSAAPAAPSATSAATTSAALAPAPATTTTAPAQRHPIHDIGDVLTPTEIERHLRRLSPDDLRAKYGAHVPELMSATVHDLMEIVRCGFFHQAQARLSLLVAGPGSAVVAGAVGYAPQGPGVEAMLRGIRHQQQQQQKQDADESSTN